MSAALAVPAPVLDLCPVCEEHPASAGFSGCCDRWCEGAYHEHRERLRHAAEVAEVEE